MSCTEEHFLELSFDIIFVSFCQGSRSFGELEEMERLGYLVEEAASNKVSFVHCRTFGALVL